MEISPIGGSPIGVSPIGVRLAAVRENDVSRKYRVFATYPLNGPPQMCTQNGTLAKVPSRFDEFSDDTSPKITACQLFFG